MPDTIADLEARLVEARARAATEPGAAASIAVATIAAELGWELAVADPDRCRALTEEALAIGDHHGSAEPRACALRNLAFMRRMGGDFEGALAQAREASALFDALGDPTGGADTADTLTSCYLELGAHARALEHAVRGLELARASGSERSTAWALQSVGRAHIAMGDRTEGARWVREALAVFERIAHIGGIARSQGLLGDLAEASGDRAAALEHVDRAIELWRTLGSRRGHAFMLLSRARLILDDDPAAALALTDDIHALQGDNPLPDLEAPRELVRGRAFARLGRSDEAVTMFEAARERARVRRALHHEAEAEARLAELWEQREQPARALAHAKRWLELERAARDAASAELARNVELGMRVAAAEREAQVTERLLLGTLPAPIVRELKLHGRVDPVQHEAATVLFTDLVGFTGYAARVAPRTLVEELDALFGTFDQLVAVHGLEKLKTIGDAYMAVAGAPVSRGTHAIRAVLAAFALRDAVNARTAARPDDPTPWRIRVGLHSGGLVAGVIGRDKLAYDVWGDTVNTASRMESSGVPGELNVSSATYELVVPYVEAEPRGAIEAKGKGKVEMFLIKRLAPRWSADAAGGVPNEALLAELAHLEAAPEG